MAKRKAATEQQDGNAAEMVGGGEDVGVLSPRSLIEAATAMNPLAMARESARLYCEWLKIMTGRSAREVPATPAIVISDTTSPATRRKEGEDVTDRSDRAERCRRGKPWTS